MLTGLKHRRALHFLSASLTMELKKETFKCCKMPSSLNALSKELITGAEWKSGSLLQRFSLRPSGQISLRETWLNMRKMKLRHLNFTSLYKEVPPLVLSTKSPAEFNQSVTSGAAGRGAFTPLK